MAVLFATLGFTAKLALAPLRDDPSIDEVHIFYGKPLQKDGREALAAAKATTETLGIKMVEHPVKDAFDYQAVLEALNRELRKVKGKPVKVNGSGGTRVMVMAATIFAFTQDVPLLYYDEYQTTGGKEIPLKALRSLRDLGETQRSILHRLKAKGSADMSTLATELHVAPSTLSVHVQRLAESGTVTVQHEGKRRIVSLLPELERMDVVMKA